MVSEALVNDVVPTSSSSSWILTSGASGRISALFSLRLLRILLMLINAAVMLLLLPFRGRRLVSVVEKPRKDERQHDCLRKLAAVRLPATIVPWKSSMSVSSKSCGGVSSAAMAVQAAADQAAAARRAMAIRRVTEDSDRSSLREYSLMDTKRGDTIFTQSWTPVSAKIRGLVLLLHGLNEHSSRYNDFAKQLNANGFKVYGMDWVGHGGSDGLHAYVHSLDEAVSDMKVLLEKILNENPGLPCFCFGHSTGAAIVLKALLDPKVESRVSGAVLTSPAVGVQPSHPILLVLAPIVSFLLPTYQFNSAYKKGLPVCRDPDALISKYSDPLVCTGSLRVRTGHEIVRITTYLQQNLRKLRVPFLVLHGAADTVTDPEASQKLYEEASSTDKTIKLYEGLLHDLLFEPERDAITQDIIQWLNSRI
ncbi:Monoglyceride lipase [Senna tora]|uniref:Monoglyceride lipase n=1 Tax=Senna tora TaxID=362788 RepID=A0A834WIJ7_9FABA|nr:Monoglyceride lipase [Senna tora]